MRVFANKFSGWTTDATQTLYTLETLLQTGPTQYGACLNKIKPVITKVVYSSQQSLSYLSLIEHIQEHIQFSLINHFIFIITAFPNVCFIRISIYIVCFVGTVRKRYKICKTKNCAAVSLSRGLSGGPFGPPTQSSAHNDTAAVFFVLYILYLFLSCPTKQTIYCIYQQKLNMFLNMFYKGEVTQALLGGVNYFILSYMPK